MGGAIAAPGNATTTAEANILHDPEAADIVFIGFTNIVLVVLDVTMKVFLKREHLDQLLKNDNPIAQFSGEILDHYLNFYESVGCTGCAMHDPLAALLAVLPELAQYSEWPIWSNLMVSTRTP